MSWKDSAAQDEGHLEHWVSKVGKDLSLAFYAGRGVCVWGGGVEGAIPL